LIKEDRRKIIPWHPKELPHLERVDEQVVYKYLMKQGLSFSMYPDLYLKHPDILVVRDSKLSTEILTWIKPTTQKTRKLSSIEYKTLMRLAKEYGCFRGFMLIKKKKCLPIKWLTINRINLYFVVSSNLTMF